MAVHFAGKRRLPVPGMMETVIGHENCDVALLACRHRR